MDIRRKKAKIVEETNEKKKKGKHQDAAKLLAQNEGIDSEYEECARYGIKQAPVMIREGLSVRERVFPTSYTFELVESEHHVAGEGQAYPDGTPQIRRP